VGSSYKTKLMLSGSVMHLSMLQSMASSKLSSKVRTTMKQTEKPNSSLQNDEDAETMSTLPCDK
jgi:hypothetical protein